MLAYTVLLLILSIVSEQCLIMKKKLRNCQYFSSGSKLSGKFPVAIFFLSIPIFLSCGKKGGSGQSPEARPGARPIVVEAVVARVSSISHVITVSGTLIPFEETTLMPEVGGRVINVNLPEGRFVKAGTLLVKLFDGDLQAQLKKYQTQLEIAGQTLNRQAELIKVNGISQSDFDQTQLQVASIKNDIELTKSQIRKTEVLAPYDGIIGLKNISIGAQVSPSTPLAVIREQDRLKLDFSIPEKYSRTIREGSKVKFTVQGDTIKYNAIVMATEQGIEETTRNLRARAIVTGKFSSLIPGTFANVELILGENQVAIMLPTQCIIPQARDKSVIIVKGGKAIFTKVETGSRRESDIEITKGVNAGDTVVTTGIMFIKPGAPVKLSMLKK
jgi:membrane fusion protein, multidrug efflux system